MNVTAAALRPSTATASTLRSIAGGSLVSADSVRVNGGTPEKPGFYHPGRVMVRAATGAIGGAITMALTGGGILATAAFGAGVYGAIGLVVGAAFGAVAGAAAGAPGTGAVVGGVAGGASGAVRGAIRGAILGGLAGVFGGSPMGGALAGGLLAAAGI